MTALNRVFLAGNLTRDPEVRYIPSGTAVADLGLAVNERYKDSSTQEWKERPQFFDIVVWGRQAETSAEYLSKGSPVLIEGRLQLDSWETKDGEKRSRLKVVADRVQFLGGPKRAERGDAPRGSAARPSAPPAQEDAAPPPQEDAAPAPQEDAAPAPQEDAAPAPQGEDSDDLPF